MAQPDLSVTGVKNEYDALGAMLGLYDTVPMADQQAQSLDKSAANIRQLFTDYQQPEKRNALSYAPAALTGLGALIDLLSGDSDRQAGIAPKVGAITAKVQAQRDKKAQEKRQKFLDAMGVESTTANLGQQGFSIRSGARTEANQNKRSVLNDTQQIMDAQQSAYDASQNRELSGKQLEETKRYHDALISQIENDISLSSGADIKPAALVKDTFNKIYEEERKLQGDRLKNAVDFEERKKIEAEIRAVAEWRTAEAFGYTPEQIQALMLGKDVESVMGDTEEDNPADYVPAEEPSKVGGVLNDILSPFTGEKRPVLGKRREIPAEFQGGETLIMNKGESFNPLDELAGILPVWLDKSPLSMLLKDRIEKQRLSKWHSKVKKKYEIVGQ